LPCHPSNVVTIRELINDPSLLEKSAVDITNKVTKDGKILAGQGIIAGCAGGTFDNLRAAADILKGKSCGSGEFALSVYPASQPVFSALITDGAMSDLVNAGAVIRTAFCGPCFGAGDVPANGALSLRHSTRNFPNREGSKPSEGQTAAVALMDARSIAATAANGGILTAADTLDIDYTAPEYTYDDTSYRNRVYNGYGKPDPDAELKFGPNITDWPAMEELGEDMLIQVASLITDPVTTTDELIPSGESSSYRSNPIRLAQLTLSRKDPEYVGRAKAALNTPPAYVTEALSKLGASDKLSLGSVVYAVKPGDGSAREQAASCQRVLGGLANIANEYATKRYRSNLINWGMIPFIFKGETPFEVGDYIYIKGIRAAVANADETIEALVIRDGGNTAFTLEMPKLTSDERDIMLDGCLINYYRAK
nr:hydratase [Clostridia bacterium]